MKNERKIIENICGDLVEVYNNLLDDLGVDLDEAQEVYKTSDLNKARIKSIHKYTKKLLDTKWKKWKKICKKNQKVASL